MRIVTLSAVVLFCIRGIVCPTITAPSGDAPATTLSFEFNEDQVSLDEFVRAEDSDAAFKKTRALHFIEYLARPGKVVTVRAVLSSSGTLPVKLFFNLASDLNLPTIQTTKLLQNYMGKRLTARASTSFEEVDRLQFAGLRAFEATVANNSVLQADFNFDIRNFHCDAAYFYGLLNFAQTIECLQAIPRNETDLKDLSGLVADLYFGELSRADFVEKDDVEAIKWIKSITDTYETGGFHANAANALINAGISLLSTILVNQPLLKSFIRAMITIRLSGAIKQEGELYAFLIANHIQDEHVFAGRIPLHGVTVAFRLNDDYESARFAIINSGLGISYHPKKDFRLEALSQTVGHDTSSTVSRYAPYVVYDSVPLSRFHYGVADSVEALYFMGSGSTIPMSTTPFEDWQYIDDQRGQTCFAVSLWFTLYWLEQSDQTKLEKLRHALLFKIFSAGIEQLRSALAIGRDTSDRVEFNIKDFAVLFLSVGMSTALRSIKILQSQGMDFVPLMVYYKRLWESEGEWMRVKENVEDVYAAVHNTVFPHDKFIVKRVPKVSILDGIVYQELDKAINSRSPFDFTQAVVEGLLAGGAATRIQFFERIHEAAKHLKLRKHHKNLIIRAMTQLLSEHPRPTTLKFLRAFCFELNFPLVYVYEELSVSADSVSQNMSEDIVFTQDSDMLDYAVDSTTMLSQPKILSVLARHFPEGRQEFVDKIMLELAALPQHVFAYHLSRMMCSNEILPSDLDKLKLPKWRDFELELLNYAAPNPETRSVFADILGFSKDVQLERELPTGERRAEKQVMLRKLGSSPSEEMLKEYVAHVKVNGQSALAC